MKRGCNVPMEALLISSAGLASAQNAVNLYFVTPSHSGSSTGYYSVRTRFSTSLDALSLKKRVWVGCLTQTMKPDQINLCFLVHPTETSS